MCVKKNERNVSTCFIDYKSLIGKMKIEKQTTLEQNERKTEKSINTHTSSSFTECVLKNRGLQRNQATYSNINQDKRTLSKMRVK